MRSVSIVTFTAVGFVILFSGCSSNSPTAPQALNASGLPVTPTGLPVLEFSIDLTGPARGSVVAKGTHFSVTNSYTARGPASWMFAVGLVRDDGATFVLQRCSYGGSSGGGTIVTGPGGSSEFMDGSIYLFSHGHTVNAVSLAKYSISPSDYAEWANNGWLPGPVPVYTGARPTCIFSGEPTTPGSTAAADQTIRMDQATERRDIPMNWRVE